MKYYIGNAAYDSDYLEHFGIKGMQWGRRRWQNGDGTFNEAGKQRYFGSNGDNKPKTKISAIERGYREGTSSLTKKSGKERSVIGALARNYVKAGLRSTAKSVALLGGTSAAIIAAAAVNPSAAPTTAKLIMAGASIAGTIMGVKESARYVSSQVATIRGASERKNKKALSK